MSIVFFPQASPHQLQDQRPAQQVTGNRLERKEQEMGKNGAW